MFVTLKLKVTKAHLEWAVYQFLKNEKKLSKKAILEYLKNQYERFGTADISLMGENDAGYFDEYMELADLDVDEEEFEYIKKAKEWVSKKFDNQ